MRTRREPQSAPDANHAGAVERGIRRFERTGRPKPFAVQWSEPRWDPKLKRIRRTVSTEFFPTAALRDRRYADLVAEKRAGTLQQATRQEIAEWRAFQAAVEGESWQKVVAGWKAWLQHNGVAVTPHKVREAVRSYLERYARLTATGQRAAATEKKVARILERFAAAHAHRDLDTFEADELEDWIDGLDDVLAEATFNSYRRGLHALFQFHLDRGALRRNPASLVPMRDDLNETVGLLTIEQTARLMHTAYTFFDTRGGHRFRPMLPRIALETFAGLRYSSALRLVKEDVNFADRGVLLPKRMLKTKKRHYISGFPDVLWSWLELAAAAWPQFTEREYRRLKTQLFATAQVPHPRNCLRHGFASYLLAAEKNPGRVAYLLAHKSQQELWDHYHGRVTEADGTRFKALTPAAAARLAGEPPAAAPPAAGQPPPE